ncbi:hypothetical protein HC251_16580 [Iamia sp. SCSIO 61187]|uniref:hypothetical protein n=1 Tax=Iamia sp. SCSIO 61187 TaxID=2722752 RepID=UPI001C62AA64|nr:hypothetical protein [Iamia sp. SCSIO 61187]QYG93885.1 hypothetical protein HC251_16580 [Iamia sp. SCSIO 61187]
MPVLILLAIVWAIVLVPPLVRNRADLRPGSSVSSFRQDLAVIGRTTPTSSLRPPSLAPIGSSTTRAASGAPLAGTPAGRSAARKRRRDVLFTLGGAAGFTLLLALAFGGPMLLLHLAVDVALGAYVYLLVQMRKLAEEQAVKVRYLAAPAQSQPRLVAVRRTASG